jgi:hypothetical protein
MYVSRTACEGVWFILNRVFMLKVGGVSEIVACDDGLFVCVCVLTVQTQEICRVLYTTREFYRQHWQSEITQKIPFSICYKTANITTSFVL